MIRVTMCDVAKWHFLPQRPSALSLAWKRHYRGATAHVMVLGKCLPTPVAQPWVAKGLDKRQSSLYAGLNFSPRIS